MMCACPCGKEFEPKRKNQIYLSAEHRRRDSNRRWPVKRQSLLPVSFRNAYRGRQRAETGYVTSHKGTEMPETLTGTLVPEFLTTSDVAQVLQLSTWTVRRWRKADVGPPFIKISRRTLRYPRPFFDDWVTKHMQSHGSDG